MLSPLQFGGIPGGIELLIIGLIFLLILALPVGLVIVIIWALRRRRGRVEELESRVSELERELEEASAPPVETDPADTGDDQSEP